ncbi:coiled-coil domain-containing protein 9-like [Cherax quadricarinatus]
MSLDSGMSREEKEKLLNQKMENIRRKNEELRKRHQEIEADKKNADIFSSTVTMDEVKPYKMKMPRVRPERSDRPREMLDHPPPPRPADIMPSRQRLSENDGPPPDPSYRFLSDPDRDGIEIGRDKREWGRGGRGRGKRGGRGGGSLWDGSGEDRGMESTCDREGRGIGRGGRGGFNFSEGENDGKLDSGQTEGEYGSRGDRGFNRGRGRGRSNGNSFNSDGERGYECGRGGRGRFNEKLRQENENFGAGYGAESSDCGAGGGDEGRRGKLSFASRDIRYYPDDNEDQRSDKGKGRGRGKYTQRYQDDYEDKGRQRERGRGRNHFEHRGRGRARGHGQHHEYERWKAEREAIDEERLIRGRTHEGAWRREWDNDKLEQSNVEEVEPAYDPRFPKSKGKFCFHFVELLNILM